MSFALDSRKLLDTETW